MISTRQLVFLVFVHICLTITTNFPSGFTNSTVNTAVVYLHRFINESLSARDWHVSDKHVLWYHAAILNIWFVSQVLGSLVAPFLCDKWGRKVGYIIGVAVTCLATVVQILSFRFRQPEVLILGRGMTAFVSPLLDTCMILYVQETVPLQLRGMLSFLPELGYSSMCVLGSVLGTPEVLGNNLERLFLVSLVPEAISLVFLFFVPETPKFLFIMKNKREKAMASLEFFQGRHEKENQLTMALYQKEKDTDTAGKKRSSIPEVLRKWQLRRAALLGSALYVLTISFYPMLQSSTYFFIGAGFTNKFAEYASIGLLALIALSTLVGSQFIDRLPRRKLVLVVGAVCNVFLAIFAIASSQKEHSTMSKIIGMGSVVLYIVAYGLVLGPLAWFLGPELVSQRHKSTVFSLLFMVGNICISVTNSAVLPLFQLIGGLVFIPLFVLPSTGCLIFLYFCLPETLGKETHEIIEEMTGRRLARKQKNEEVADDFSSESGEEEEDRGIDNSGYSSTLTEKA